MSQVQAPSVPVEQYLADKVIPMGCRIRVVQHLPFSTRRILTRTVKEGVPNVQEGGPADGSADETDNLLRLQQYARELKAQLRRSLPHRISRLDLEALQLGDQRRLRAGEVVFEPLLEKANMWDSGHGVLEIKYEAEFGAHVTFHQLRLAIDQLHDAAVEYWASCTSTLVDSYFRFELPDYLAVYLDEESATSAPLWVHDVVVVTPPTSGMETKDADDVAAFYSDGGPSRPIHLYEREFVARFGLTACIVTDEEEIVDAAARVVEAQQAVWAAATDFGRLVQIRLSQVDIDSNSHLERLERQLNELLGLQLVAGRFTATLSNTAAHLARLDQQVWVAIAEVWRLQPELDALDNKLAALKTQYSDLATRIGVQRSRRLSEFLAAFTFLSALSAIAAVSTYVENHVGEQVRSSGQQSAGSVGVLIIVALCVLAGAGIFAVLVRLVVLDKGFRGAKEP